MSKNCPQCGEVSSQLHRGYCQDCYTENQKILNADNWEYDRWENMNKDHRKHTIESMINKP